MVIFQEPGLLSSPRELRVGGEEVHVWCVSLRVSASWLLSFKQILSTDERAKAERYRVQTARDDYIISRGLLRTLLGRYLDVPPSQLNFRYGLYGKPALAIEPGADTIHFNLSHSHGLALFAVARGRELGVDLERIRPDVNYNEIAQRVFSIREVEALRSLPLNVRREEFFTYWTCKEAYVKGRGEGF